MSNELSFADELTVDGLFSLPPELAERFYVEECLAVKEHGKTYLLSDKLDEQPYVLKTYRKEDITRDSGEAALLRGLNHPGLPKLEADIDDGETLFVLREYVEGQTLENEMANGLSEEQAIVITCRLCDLLAYLHKHSIIHRDVTPSNIIINSRSGNVSLIDFGIARRYSKTALRDTSHFGKEAYAPPEQKNGHRQTDGRSDLYSLGTVLREMLTGSKSEPAPNKKLAKIVGKCTAYEMGNRYQSAAALKQALERYSHRAARKTAPALYTAIFAGLALCAGLTAGFFAGRHTGLFAAPEPSALLFEPSPTVEPSRLTAPSPDTQPTPEQNPGPSAAPSPISSPVLPPNPEEVYTFTEPLIEQAARLMLGKDDDEPLTYGELAEVTEMYIWGNRPIASTDEFWPQDGTPTQKGTITSLEDMRVFLNLEEFFISEQPFSDISPLAECSKIKFFLINKCNVEDMSSLTTLPLLERLDIRNCLIVDFSFCKKLANMNHLSLWDGKFSSLDILGDNKNISSLEIHSPQFEDLSGIEDMFWLEYLIISGTSVRDFSPLNNLLRLSELIISPDMEQYLYTLDNDNVEVRIE